VAVANASTTSVRFNGVIARAGVNYHFNWDPAPVVAKMLIEHGATVGALRPDLSDRSPALERGSRKSGNRFFRFKRALHSCGIGHVLCAQAIPPERSVIYRPAFFLELDLIRSSKRFN
jgi:hypothetical protein